MKDPISVGKDGKLYLKEHYEYSYLLLRLVVIFIVLIISEMIFIWFVPMSDSYYLEVKDGMDEEHILAGEVYKMETLNDGGYHSTGQRKVNVSVSGFVYDQTEIGDVLSIKRDESGNYVYTGEKYSHISEYQTTNGFINFATGIGILLVGLFGVVLIYYVWSKERSRIIKVDDFEPYRMEDRWYGKYIYGHGRIDNEKFGMIRIEDTMMFMELEDDPLSDDEKLSFFTIRSRFKRFRDMYFKIDKALDIHYNGKEQK